jgi:hypothetical protein
MTPSSSGAKPVIKRRVSKTLELEADLQDNENLVSPPLPRPLRTLTMSKNTNSNVSVRDERVTRNASAHVSTNECPFPTCFFGERGREKVADWTMRVEISIV